MDRTVPSTASEEIELYLRTVYSLLRSTTDVQIRTLEEVHAGMNSSLHLNTRRPEPDTSAFIYSLLRLPDIMPEVRTIVLGQSPEVFKVHGFKDVEGWQQIEARARRRRCYFNGKDTLACLIASRSDIDDVIPTLTAFQIEWNKIHNLLAHRTDNEPGFFQQPVDSHLMGRLPDMLKMSLDDVERLKLVWGEAFLQNLEKIAQRPCALKIRLLSGSLNEYWRATKTWLVNIESVFPDLAHRPVYFISSNTHSVPNLLSGYATQKRTAIIDFLEKEEKAELSAEWIDIQKQATPSSLENFIYYCLKKYQQSQGDRGEEQSQFEREHGILRIPSEHTFDMEAQAIDLSKIDPSLIDPRLWINPITGQEEDLSMLSKSDAVILNIDYPLGFAAYHVLSKVAEHSSSILGVYVMGKAATLNGINGDVMIPIVVQDEHSRNTYLFQNAFTAADVAPYLVFGSVLDNQKGVSVLGTFLQNARVMDVIYREGYSDIEMEAGPYLSAVYEMTRPNRHPVNEIVNLYGIPFDLGILHYASDTPLSKGKNLGAGTMSYFGMDSTYASAVAIIRRIFTKERQRV
jgi:hypothetical protein